MQYLKLNPKKRPRNINKEIVMELIEYLKEEVRKQHFPSRREIESTFKIRLNSYFKNVQDLYDKAEEDYKICANQGIKSIKAKLLLELIVKNINKFGLRFILSRNIHERGIDILAKEKEKIVGIEIKAYNKNEKIKYKDITQVKKSIEKENLSKAIIITTTDKKDGKIVLPNNIFLVNYTKLLKILNIAEDKDLNFIRDYSINREDMSRNVKRQRILDYVYEKSKKEKRKPGYTEILRELHLDLYSYFKNISEIYKILKIPPPLKNMKGKGAKEPDQECVELWKEEFKRYILEKVKNEDRYPSGEELEKHFKISHIWNITNMSELYKELNLKPYLERGKRITSSLKP